MDHESTFWNHAEQFLQKPGVTRSTMMGLPCLRIEGKFFGSFDRKTGDLLIKVPVERVDALIAAGSGQAFAPAGKRFREWVAISPENDASWPGYLDEALRFVAEQS